MGRITSFTVKIDNEKRDLMKTFCERSGIKMQKFLEKAIVHEVKREIMKEDLYILDEYEKHGKKSASSYREFMKELGLKE
ncbi:MAG TPA: hypothetical protein ENN55_01855 [Firmicutes bacterium]|nr:hypothetical protein [Bacillota bacterium]